MTNIAVTSRHQVAEPTLPLFQSGLPDLAERVDEALDALDRYLDDAGLAGLDQVVVIHGLGTGALRDAVRARAGRHPLVTSTRPGERGEGGDGATIIRL